MCTSETSCDTSIFVASIYFADVGAMLKQCDLKISRRQSKVIYGTRKTVILTQYLSSCECKESSVVDPANKSALTLYRVCSLVCAKKLRHFCDKILRLQKPYLNALHICMYIHTRTGKIL